ncbi:hypothetical protein HPP92_019475 [Vanilla planifolia]|uniref:Uncharacterized protein n=1 Tax=Vanilla planifolia TaxID=51239 RepID=A0A835UL58_VANPL|nr:hypothetical protein HPP92_019475 [Vanilla planifolia]
MPLSGTVLIAFKTTSAGLWLLSIPAVTPGTMVRLLMGAVLPAQSFPQAAQSRVAATILSAYQRNFWVSLTRPSELARAQSRASSRRDDALGTPPAYSGKVRPWAQTMFSPASLRELPSFFTAQGSVGVYGPRPMGHAVDEKRRLAYSEEEWLDRRTAFICFASSSIAGGGGDVGGVGRLDFRPGTEEYRELGASFTSTIRLAFINSSPSIHFLDAHVPFITKVELGIISVSLKIFSSPDSWMCQQENVSKVHTPNFRQKVKMRPNPWLRSPGSKITPRQSDCYRHLPKLTVIRANSTASTGIPRNLLSDHDGSIQCTVKSFVCVAGAIGVELHSQHRLNSVTHQSDIYGVKKVVIIRLCFYSSSCPSHGKGYRETLIGRIQEEEKILVCHILSPKTAARFNDMQWKQHLIAKQMQNSEHQRFQLHLGKTAQQPVDSYGAADVYYS